MGSNKINRRKLICNMIGGAIFGAYFYAPAVVLAEETTVDDPVRHARLLERFDRNGDGIIGDDERQHIRDVRNRPDVDRQGSPRRDRIRDHFDRNDNDRLDPRERRHLRKFRDRLDRNDDGRIGKREKRAFRKKRSNRTQ